MFDTIAARGRTKSRVMAYLLNVDVVGHLGGLDQAVAMLVEIDRRIRAFKADHRRRFQFTLFADHGNAHQRSLLVDPVQILTDVGVASVDALSPARRADDAVGAAAAAAAGGGRRRPRARELRGAARRPAQRRRHRGAHVAPPDVDLAVARLADDAGGAQRFGIWRQGALHRFSRDAAGTIVVDEPDAWAGWAWTSARGATPAARRRRWPIAQAFDATAAGPYPDIFYRVATAFTHAAARFPADILLSMPDDVASYGFAVPGAVADVRAADGFHGALSRASTLSVVASDSNPLPPAVRSDDLADLFPVLGGER